MGGLIDDRSDPRGIFIFRHVPFGQLSMEQQLEWEAKGYGAGMDVPTVYRVNLLEPRSMFLMQRFPIQDKDIVYVSNAPLAEFLKFLRMIFSITSPINFHEEHKYEFKQKRFVKTIETFVMGNNHYSNGIINILF